MSSAIGRVTVLEKALERGGIFKILKGHPVTPQGFDQRVHQQVLAQG